MRVGHRPLILGTRGFSLIEMLVVIGLAGLISLLALPSVTSYFKLSLNTAAREMAAVIKEAYNSTIMTGNVHRVVYDLKTQSFWVESGPPTVLLHTEETREREESRQRYKSESDKPPPSEFSMSKSVTRKKIGLPDGVIFEDIFTEQSKEALTEGLAYTHIFPNGVTEQTIVHLKDKSDHQVSLVISALIGRTRLYERYVNVEEAYGYQ